MFFLILVARTFSCPLESEDALVAALNSGSFGPSNECVKEALDRSWYDAATLLVAKAVEQEIPLDGSHKILAQAQKRKLEKFISALDNSSNLQVVSPAYQWAQSPSTLYLDIKFSHRLDSPGCLEVSNPEVSLTDTKLSFIANCARSTQRIKLVLELEFYSEINAEESSYSFTSVGRLNVNLKKREESAWPKPMKGKKPNNVHTWWEMKEKYQKVMNKFTGEDDEEDEGKNRLKKSPEGMLNKENKEEL